MGRSAAPTSAAQSCVSALGWRLAPLAEDECSAVVGAGVLEVELARVGRRPLPRVVREQLGVGVDLHGDGALGRRGVLHPQAEQRGAPAVRGEVGARELQPAGRRQVHADVAPAAGEARGGADPLVADAEPDAVDELQRLRPHAAHLAADVPALRVERAVLEAHDVCAVARGDVAALLEAVGGRELRCRLRGGRGQQRERGQQDEYALHRGPSSSASGFATSPWRSREWRMP